MKSKGRPKMLRAAEIPQLLDKVTAARAAGATLMEVLAALTRPLIAMRSDDRERILRSILRAFRVARELRPGVLVVFGIFPSPIRPRGRKPRKTKRRPIVRDLGRRRHCGYGSGAYCGKVRIE